MGARVGAWRAEQDLPGATCVEGLNAGHTEDAWPLILLTRRDGRFGLAQRVCQLPVGGRAGAVEVAAASDRRLLVLSGLLLLDHVWRGLLHGGFR